MVGGRAVLAPSRTPVAGVRVLLLRADAGSGAAGAPTVVDSAVTAADGVFYVSGPAAGTFRLELRMRGDEADAQFESPPIALAVGEVVERDFMLTPVARAAVQPAGTGGGPAGREPYLEIQVEQPVQQLVLVRPEFPRELRDRPAVPSADLRVLVQFVVDTRGRPDMRTFRVLEAADGLLISPVRAAVSQSRFKPARLGGRPVRQLVQQPYHFGVRTTGVGPEFRP